MPAGARSLTFEEPDSREAPCPEPREFQEGLRGGGRVRMELGKIEGCCFPQSEEHL